MKRFILFIIIFFILLTQQSSAAEDSQVIPIPEDTYVEENFPLTKTYLQRHLFLGNDHQGKGITRIFIPYIQIEEFDSVFLNMYLYKNYGEESVLVDMGISFNLWQPEIIHWNNQHECLVRDSIEISPNLGWKRIDITNLYKDPEIHKGICLKFNDESNPAMVFWSKNCVDAPNLPKCLNNEVPFLEIVRNIPEEEEDPVITDEVVEHEEPKSEKSEPKDTNITPEIIVQTEDSKDVKGIISKIIKEKPKISNGSCVINYMDGKVGNVGCSLSPPKIDKIVHEKEDKHHTIKISGRISNKVIIKINYQRCKKKSISDIRTFFKCIPETYKSTSFQTKTRNTIISNLESNRASYTTNSSGEFYYHLTTTANYSGRNLTISTQTIISDTVNGTRFVFRESSPKSNAFKVPKSRTVQAKPLNYVFSKLYGVTQWYGYTEFQSPHTGIDFGVTKKEILSPADGIVSSVGYDKYYGKCLSGGNYIKILHDNGLTTVFYHLNKIYVKKGDRVTKGKVIAISGNSGSFNCQPLSYHLHFETRNILNKHTDPVPLVSTNWANVPTLNWKTYPGRLSGNNPHPNY